MTESPAIAADRLVKNFGGTRALAGLDLAVPQGTIYGLLGPNGAGKTTAVRVFATLLRPDGGRAQVLGRDVAREAARVRESIGLTGQYAALDDYLTGRANLIMIGRLSRLSAAAAKARAGELLDRFGLAGAANRSVKTYSGGMRRRLDLAASLIARPAVLFLDEPTTGLDPSARASVWEMVRALAADGTTLLLTTQYLEEADKLAGRIAVIDSGAVIAEGTPDELKSGIGDEHLEVTLAPDADLGAAVIALKPFASGAIGPGAIGPGAIGSGAIGSGAIGSGAIGSGAIGSGAIAPDGQPRRLSVPVSASDGLTTLVVRALDDAGVRVNDVTIRRASLDDVFLSLTGHAA